MARWERGLKAHEETEKENEPQQAKVGGLFVSVWQDGSIIETTATLNTETGEITTTQSNIPDHILERQYFENQDDIFEVCTECHEYILKAQMIPDPVGKGMSEEMACSNPNCDSRKE
jgi:hypothetical protein